MAVKVCFKCGESKPLSDFYRHAGMADGHLGKCKECTKADARLHRRNSDSVREYDRARFFGERKRRIAETTKLWKEKNPERYKAHTITNNAVRDGRLKKGACEVCGSEKVHAHHDDYAKPLEVRWLCPLHHARLHAET